MMNAVLRFAAHPHINPLTTLPPQSRQQFLAALFVTWMVVLGAALVLWLSYSEVIAAEAVVAVGAIVTFAIWRRAHTLRSRKVSARLKRIST